MGRINVFQKKYEGGDSLHQKTELIPLNMSACTTEDRTAINQYWEDHEINGMDDKSDEDVRCFYSASAYIESESWFRSNYGAVVVGLEHCIEYESLENCASEEEAMEFWSSKQGQV